MLTISGILAGLIAFVIGWTVELKIRPVIKEGLEDMRDTVKSILPKKKK